MPDAGFAKQKRRPEGRRCCGRGLARSARLRLSGTMSHQAINIPTRLTSLVPTSVQETLSGVAAWPSDTL